MTFAEVEIRNYRQGNAEVVLTYTHPNIRIVTTCTAAGVLTSSIEYLFTDQLGSIRDVVKGTTRMSYAVYEPFGKPIETVVQPSMTPEAHGFIGERFDPATQLQYLNARYYDPELALFIQPDWLDPMLPGVGTHRYAYAGQDPVNARDPGGNAWYDNWDDFTEAVGNIFSGAVAGGSANADFNATITSGGAGAAAGYVVGATSGTAASCTVTGCATAPLAGPGGGLIGAGIGLIAGGAIGLVVDGGQIVVGAIVGGYQGALNTETSDDEETRDSAPTGSRGIDQTPWSGDHNQIKDALDLGGRDRIKISPDEEVWAENPNGTWTNHGPAGNFTESGQPSGQTGRDRERR